MCKTFLVTSCKGGVGKSTFAANLSMALASRQKKVVLIDMDLGNRSLDLILGCEDKLVYDISDVCRGTVEYTDALIELGTPRNFSFIGAPFMYDDSISTESLDLVIRKIREQMRPDYIILDTSGGADVSVQLCASVAEEALIVSSRNPTALRAAAKSAALLNELGVSSQKLVINGFELFAEDSEGRAGILEMIDSTGLVLLGIIPKDRQMEILQEKGKLSLEAKGVRSANAFLNVAARLEGERVPLLKKIKGLGERRRRKLLSGN